MTECILELDNLAISSLDELMTHFNVHSRAEVICKAVAFLKLVAHIDKSNGNLYARRDGKETKIIVH